MTHKWLVAADDRSVLWRPFEERLATTENPRQRQILQTIIEHLRTESGSDLDGVMATVAPDAEFSSPYGPGPKGWDEVRAHYTQVFASGGIGNMAVKTLRVIVDDNAIVNEYIITLIAPWQMAKELGYAIAEEEGHYAVRQQVSTILPFDDAGLLRGEISYGGRMNPFDCERVPDDELSPGYLTWLAGVPTS